MFLEKVVAIFTTHPQEKEDRTFMNLSFYKENMTTSGAVNPIILTLTILNIVKKILNLVHSELNPF